MCLMCLMLLVLLDCIFSLPLWFSLMFINIPLFTILLGGFDIVDVVDATVDGVDFSGSLSANINKNIINFNAKNAIYIIYY